MIETTRLRLAPLKYDQLLQYIQNDGSLEVTLQLNPTVRTMSPELKEALTATILPNVADPNNNYLYATLWSIILKSENKMVGDVCFIGPPDEQGEIEIGYGTYDAFQKNGYMTESVGGMIEWAKTRPDIKAIIASTDQANVASWAVLERNGFVKYGATDGLFHWHRDMKNSQ
jgi:[ribosomal protein S5]-alanine N-acetyltransferase